ncbi:MAG TPA: protein kinase [Candidatus Sulfotelmatobacter sp.]|nr:protein kinase [Candidatus Sulfotelmatobacter sp.]
MPLASGTKLGPYEIQSRLGAGGMGEVYRARDIRLGRDVAIKVLPEHLSADLELKQRMEREARSISSLNHPHICTLHDIGSQEGLNFLVMELLEGQTLSERLAKGPLPLDQVLKIGTEIAEALEKAHQQGIIHRDLKPANIMLTKAGAKLMDFGLAKPKLSIGSQAVGPFTPSTPTMNLATLTSAASPLTQKGLIVGTFQYMAPEVLQGAEADARSDIFSLGCVLYEMLTGRRAFEGKSQLSVFTAILEKDPEPIAPSEALAPRMLDLVIRGCLAKEPGERFQSAHDVAMNLGSVASLRSAAVEKEPSLMKSRLRGWWLGAVVTAIVLGVLAGFLLRRTGPPDPSIRASLNPPPGGHFRLTSDLAGPPVLSPDGSNLVFTANGMDGKTSIWVRPMDGAEARALPDTNDAIFPFWSPDSRSIGFFSNGKLRTIDLNGTTAQPICDAQLGRGGAWGANGVIVFSPSPIAPLFQVSANGGTPSPVTKIDPTLYSSHRWPFFLPDGKHFLYFAMHHDPSKVSNNGIYYASLDGRENHLVIRSQSNGVYAAGFLLFNRADQLMAEAFDPATGELKGEAQPLSAGVLNDVSTWHTTASASDNGLLIFANGSSGGVQLVWMDRNGKEQGVAADNLQNLNFAALSPQGDRIALTLDSGVNDIWSLDLARGVRTRLTFGPTGNTFPVWSPDGKWIAYSSMRASAGGIYRKPSDGAGSEELLVPDTKEGIFAPTDWSHDGKTLFYSPNSFTQKDVGVWAVSLEGDRKAREIIPGGSNATLSPNGRWLAYNSAESGRTEIYVEAYGGGQGKWQVSSNGGQAPHWGADGKEIYYFDRNQSILAIPVNEKSGALQFGAPQTLVSQWTILTIPFYSISPDRKRLLMERVSQQVNQPVTVLTHFTAGLKR